MWQRLVRLLAWICWPCAGAAALTLIVAVGSEWRFVGISPRTNHQDWEVGARRGGLFVNVHDDIRPQLAHGVPLEVSFMYSTPNVEPDVPSGWSTFSWGSHRWRGGLDETAPTRQNYQFAIPLWTVSVAFAMAATFCFVARRKWLANTGECTHCRYPLSGAALCPECGQPA